MIEEILPQVAKDYNLSNDPNDRAISGSSSGGNASFNVPVGTFATGTGFDSTVSNVLDCFFTQTVATGSMTLQQYDVTYKT